MPGGAIVFVTLAMNQTEFYLGLADALRTEGHEVVLLAFHERSLERIRRAGHVAVSGFEHVSRTAPSREEVLAVAQDLGIDNLNRLFCHEKTAFETSDTRGLETRFVGYVKAVLPVLDDLRRRFQEVTVIQEVGGFLSCLSVYFAARKLRLRNVVIEPSFFRGRVFLTLDSLEAPRVPARPSQPAGLDVQRYLAETRRTQSIVIPVKDAHQYRDITAKVTRPYNLKRLVQKLVDKHLLGYREEFSHIWVWTRRHLRMLVNKYALSGLYRGLPSHPYVYYPLHVPTDFALTVRSPEYLDQYALLDYVAKVLPLTHTLVLKEHPALVGAVDRRRIRSLLRANGNVALLDPTLNNYTVMKSAAAVLTVNSKSGAEALLVGTPVIATGDSFYASSGLVETVDRLSCLEGALREVLDGRRSPFSEEAVEAFFQSVWERSWPGELYDARPENVRTFARSLRECLETARREMGDAVPALP
jgi:capsular polysaccharide biosynthesis protein